MSFNISLTGPREGLQGADKLTAHVASSQAPRDLKHKHIEPTGISRVGVEQSEALSTQANKGL